LKKELNTLATERDDIQLQLRRVEETLDLLNSVDNAQDEDTNGNGNGSQTTLLKLETKLKQYTRKLTIYEVNEAILSRKYHTLSEQYLNEHQIRKAIETDFVEMEGVLKRRILFLEQYKAQVKSKLEQFQRELEMSIPQSDYLIIQNELERLREDYLYSLRRELEARISSLHSLDKEREGTVSFPVSCSPLPPSLPPPPPPLSLSSLLSFSLSLLPCLLLSPLLIALPPSSSASSPLLNSSPSSSHPLLSSALLLLLPSSVYSPCVEIKGHPTRSRVSSCKASLA
jgi:hypothetical protein